MTANPPHQHSTDQAAGTGGLWLRGLAGVAETNNMEDYLGQLFAKRQAGEPVDGFRGELEQLRKDGSTFLIKKHDGQDDKRSG